METRETYKGYLIDIIRDDDPINPSDIVDDYEGNEALYQKELQDYKEGNVWGYLILDEDLQVVDSLWGFYGNPESNNMLQRARQNIDRIING